MEEVNDEITLEDGGASNRSDALDHEGKHELSDAELIELVAYMRERYQGHKGPSKRPTGGPCGAQNTRVNNAQAIE